MKHFIHLLSSKVYRQSGMRVKFHPVVQIKLILIKKKRKRKKRKKAHRGISSIQTVTLLDLSIYFRSMYTGNSHHSEGASVVLCLLGWWNWSHCAIKKHVGKYCKHCVRSDCAKQPPSPPPSARLNTNGDPNNNVVGYPLAGTAPPHPAPSFFL